jgi:hypothetical protein
VIVVYRSLAQCQFGRAVRGFTIRARTARLSGKVAVITGLASGIGRATTLTSTREAPIVNR